MKAFDFLLPDQFGNVHKLADYRGKFLVLYFYPKDDTPGCTKEACSFRDSAEQYRGSNIAVLGVSKDSIASHRKFAEKHRLNFPLLSDETAETIKAYGAWGEKKFMGRSFEGIKRTTFLIDPDGNILKTYEKVNVFTHAGQIIGDIGLQPSVKP